MKSTMKAILASIVVIALALSAISGVTYSWWSDTEQTDITIDTGYLDVSTSDFKVKYGEAELDSDDEVPATYSLSYGGTTESNLDLQEIRVAGAAIHLDPHDLDVKIQYDVTFTASLNVKYVVDVDIPEGVTATTKISDGTSTIDNGVYQEFSQTETVKELNVTYTVIVSISAIEMGVSGKFVLTNYITQLANPNALAKSADVTEESGVKVATVEDNETKTSVKASSLPDEASKFNVAITTNDTERKAFLGLTLTNSDGSKITEFDTPVQITTVLKGAYNGLYYNGDADQPTGVSYKWSVDGVTFGSTEFADAKYTEITFRTNHFSEFVAVKSSVTTADEFINAVAGGGFVKLGADITVADNLNFQTAGDYIIDLDKHTLNITGAYIGYNGCINHSTKCSCGDGHDADVEGVNLIIQNGKLVTNTESTTMAFAVGVGSSLRLDSVDYDAQTGSGIFPRGNSAKVIVNNSTITAGVYGIGTNASTNDNYNVQIGIYGSKIITSSKDGDNTAVMINVKGKLVIENSELKADRQCLIVRAGTAVVSDTTFNYTGAYTGSDGEYEGTSWASGNRVIRAAVVVGNMTSTAYNADAELFSYNCTVVLPEGKDLKTLVAAQDDVNKQACRAYVDPTKDNTSLWKSVYILTEGGLKDERSTGPGLLVP